MIYIYDKSGNLLFGGNADVKLKRRVMGEETLTVTIVSATAIAYDYGAYADARGERYYLHINPKVENNGKYNSYTLVLESAKYELGFAQMQSFGRADYDLTTDLEGWVKLIVANANRVGSGWSYVINDPDANFKTLRVDGETCLASINRIYTDFGKEFKVIGKQIVVGRVGSDLSNVLKVGRYEGLYNVTEEQSGTSSPVTRLYVYGGERNIPSNYRNPDGTTITPRLVLDAVNGGKRYIEQNVDKYGVIEDSVTFDEIYPHRTGVISSVNASDVQEFYDTSMDFDVNGQMLPGITPKVCFLTGDLAGYEFDLVSYDNTAKKFRLAVGNDGGGRELPNTSLKPKAGDKYKLVDLEMPSSYVTAGENELLAKGQETIATRSVFQSTFTATNIDPAYQQDVNFYPVPGDRIGIASNGVTKQVRIIEQTISLTSLVKIYESLAFADKVEPTALQQAANSAKATSDSIYVANKGVKDANVAAKTVTYALYDMFEIVNQGTPSAFIRAKYELHSLKDIVAFSDGTGGGAAPTIPLATYTTTGVVKVDPTTMTVDANGMIAVKGDLFNLSNYYDKSASDARFAALGHVHAFSELTGKPTTLAEYGITDAVKNTGGTIAGDLTITGNLYLQQDGKYIVTEKVYSENDFITLRHNNPSLLAAGAYTGFEAKKVFSDGSDGYLVYGNDGMARVGRLANLQVLATRDDAPTDGAIQYWSAANKRLTSGVLVSDLWHKENLNRSNADFSSRVNNVYVASMYKNAAGNNTLFVGSLDNAIGGNSIDSVLWQYGSSNLWFATNGYRRVGVNYAGSLVSASYTGSGFTATGWGITQDGDANVKNCIVRTDLSVKKTKLFGPDGDVKWTAQVSATGDYLEFYNASGALKMRLTQEGELQIAGDIKGLFNFN